MKLYTVSPNVFCIQVNKVYDSCLQQESLTDVTIPLNNLEGTAPYTFISLRNTTSEGTLENVTITRLPDRPNFARVQADVIIPLTINYSDSNGDEYTTTGSVTVHKDIILYVPDDSIIPYKLEAVVGAISVTGTIMQCCTNFVLTADICISIIMKNCCNG